MTSTKNSHECKIVICNYCKKKQQTLAVFGKKIKCPYCNRYFKISARNYVQKARNINRNRVKRGEFI